MWLISTVSGIVKQGTEMQRLTLWAGFCCLVWLVQLCTTASGAGCYWNSECINRYLGECSDGHVAVDYSDDCRGLCRQPHYPQCSLFSTRIQCCKQEIAEESDICGMCSKKLESEDHWVCCNDCSDPTVTSRSGSTVNGYCKTGAKLSVQSILPEVVQWMTGDWQACSCRGDLAVRQRDVFCVSTSNAHQYTVEDARCSPSAMPLAVEACSSHHCKHSGMSIWAIILISMLSLAAFAAAALGGYILYKRHFEDQNQGFVYVMLEGYS